MKPVSQIRNWSSGLSKQNAPIKVTTLLVWTFCFASSCFGYQRNSTASWPSESVGAKTTVQAPQWPLVQETGSVTHRLQAQADAYPVISSQFLASELPTLSGLDLPVVQGPVAATPHDSYDFPMPPDGRSPVSERHAASGDQFVVTKKKFGEHTVRVDQGDEIWLVSARDVQQPDCGPSNFHELKCSLLHGGEFVPTELSSLATAHQQEQAKSTIIYVHGNRTDLQYAKSRALQTYEILFQQRELMQGGCRPPIRFVIFAWRSESELPRMAPDFKLKSERSYGLAPVFTHLLSQFGDRRMLLLGYSLGGQIALRGVPLPEADDTKPGRYEVALIAPSLTQAYIDCELPQMPYNATIAKTTVFVNRNDRAIRIARFLLRTKTRFEPSPLERIASCSQCTAVNPVEIVNITNEVSRCHSIIKYTSDSQLIRCGILEITQRLQAERLQVEVGR